MYEQTHEIIQRYLKRGDLAADCDKKTFAKYTARQIDIETCMKIFKDNNSIPKKDFQKINQADFIRWMREIGYVRY